MPATVRLLTRSVVWAALLLGLGVLIAIIVVPRLMGWVPLTVLSGSMAPTYPAGSQIVVERVQGKDEANALEVGDVITFMPGPDDPSLITHRIVDKSWRQDGTAVFTTRGDANNVDDPWQLTAKQIRGEVRYHVPYVGHVATALQQEQKDIGIIAVAGGLFGYAALQFLRAARSRGNGGTSAASHRADAPTPASGRTS